MKSLIVIASMLVACTTTTTDNFTNPPTAIPATCAPATVVGCGAGSIGYACTSDRPDDGDVSIVCSRGTAGLGTTDFCCLPYEQAATECAPSTNIVGCEGTAFGFSCTGETSPADADSSLACSAPIAGMNGMEYCCVAPALSSECEVDGALACAGASVGYACAGDARPVQSGDAMIACDMGTAGETGSTDYCCLPFTQTDCVESSVTNCDGYGFSCTSLHRPEEANSALTCTGSAPSYCCSL